MKQQYFLNDYLDHEQHKTIKDYFLYLKLAFRPLTTLLICIILSIVVAIPCIIFLVTTKEGELANNVAFAMLTGVVASGLVSIAVEMAGNYRHNYQRLLILHEYILTVANYEEHVQWCFHGRTDDDCLGEFTARNMAVSELVLEIGPVIEAAYKDGKEYMSLEEIKHVIKVIEAASSLGELAEDFASENMINATGTDFYKCLNEPLKSELSYFAREVGISIVEGHLISVVADYILTKPTVLDELEQHRLVRILDEFDVGMQNLQSFIKSEPGYHIELIPWNKRFEKMEKKLEKRFKRSEQDTLAKLQKALKDGIISQSEYDEFLELEEKKELDFSSVYKKYDFDDDDAIEAEMQELIKKHSDKEHKRLMRKLQIIAKADGVNIDSNIGIRHE